MPRARVTWRRVVVIGALCAGVVPAVSASAHNGVGAAFKGQAGRYTVYAYDGELLPAGRIDYKLVLLDARTKNPVYDAHPAVTARRPGDDSVTAAIKPFGNVFFYNLPNPYPHDWDVHLRITGPLGNAALDYRMHGMTPTETPAHQVVSESHSSTWPWVVGAAAGGGAVAAVAYALLRVRRRAT